MTLIDVHGNPHIMTQTQVTSLIIIGWAAFFSSWIMNILYYMIHPSDVDFSPKRFRYLIVIVTLLNPGILGKNSTHTSLEQKGCFDLLLNQDSTLTNVAKKVQQQHESDITFVDSNLTFLEDSGDSEHRIIVLMEDTKLDKSEDVTDSNLYYIATKNM